MRAFLWGHLVENSVWCAAKSADDEDMDALAIALEIASAYEQLQESCATYKKASGTADEPGPSSPGKAKHLPHFPGEKNTPGRTCIRWIRMRA